MNTEKIEQLEKKIEQLKAQKQAIIAREKEKERKERTRRLIQIGAVIESRLTLTLSETEFLCDYFHEQPLELDKVKNYIQEKTLINNTACTVEADCKSEDQEAALAGSDASSKPISDF